MLKALCLFKDQFQHIKPVEEYLRGKVEFVYDSEWKEEIIDFLQPDIVIGINEHHLKIAKCYEKAQSLNIPTLTLQDGIMEWRHVFENPLHNGQDSGVPLYFPILADKFACMGYWWANLVAHLGNSEKIEVTGMPKMDCIASLKDTNEIRTKKRILIMTAAKPWFYPEQKKVVLTMLEDLKAYFQKYNQIEVIWRVTKLLDEELGVENSFKSKSTEELSQIIQRCDAVISTVSTAMIESMLLGKPVAKIDYFNSPSMFLTVWNITHKAEIDDVVKSLLKPEPTKMWLQQSFKELMILKTSNAAANVGELILKMVNLTNIDSVEKLPFENVHAGSFVTVNSKPDVALFYPKRNTFQTGDIEKLKIKLARAEREIVVLENKLTTFSLTRFLINKLIKLKSKKYD